MTAATLHRPGKATPGRATLALWQVAGTSVQWDPGGRGPGEGRCWVPGSLRGRLRTLGFTLRSSGATGGRRGPGNPGGDSAVGGGHERVWAPPNPEWEGRGFSLRLSRHFLSLLPLVSLPLSSCSHSPLPWSPGPAQPLPGPRPTPRRRPAPPRRACESLQRHLQVASGTAAGVAHRDDDAARGLCHLDSGSVPPR